MEITFLLSLHVYVFIYLTAPKHAYWKSFLNINVPILYMPIQQYDFIMY